MSTLVNGFLPSQAPAMKAQSRGGVYTASGGFQTENVNSDKSLALLAALTLKNKLKANNDYQQRMRPGIMSPASKTLTTSNCNSAFPFGSKAGNTAIPNTVIVADSAIISTSTSSNSSVALQYTNNSNKSGSNSSSGNNNNSTTKSSALTSSASIKILTTNSNSTNLMNNSAKTAIISTSPKTTATTTTAAASGNGSIINNTAAIKNYFPIPSDILDDLASRFIINVPDMELSNLIRICFQIELAHWFYLDFFCAIVEKKLQPCGIKPFAMQIFQHIPFLREHLSSIDKILEDWKEYKLSVPTYGAILISEDLNYCLLVQSYFAKSSWGFPKGKVNENEDPVHCATREVYEETGYDITELIVPNDFIEAVINYQYTRLYIVRNVPLQTQFSPRTRNEIKCCDWFPIDSLPINKNDAISKTKLGLNANSFFMIMPFIKRLKKWVNEKRPSTNLEMRRKLSSIAVGGSVDATATTVAMTTTMSSLTSSPVTATNSGGGGGGGVSTSNHKFPNNNYNNNNNNNNINNNNNNNNNSCKKNNKQQQKYNNDDSNKNALNNGDGGAVRMTAAATTATATSTTGRSKRQRHKSMGDLDLSNNPSNSNCKVTNNNNINNKQHSNSNNSCAKLSVEPNNVANNCTSLNVGASNQKNKTNNINKSSAAGSNNGNSNVPTKRQLFHSQSQNSTQNAEKSVALPFDVGRKEKQQNQKADKSNAKAQKQQHQQQQQQQQQSPQQQTHAGNNRVRAKSQSDKICSTPQQQQQQQQLSQNASNKNFHNNNSSSNTNSKQRLQKQQSMIITNSNISSARTVAVAGRFTPSPISGAALIAVASAAASAPPTKATYAEAKVTAAATADAAITVEPATQPMLAATTSTAATCVSMAPQQQQFMLQRMASGTNLRILKRTNNMQLQQHKQQQVPLEPHKFTPRCSSWTNFSFTKNFIANVFC